MLGGNRPTLTSRVGRIFAFPTRYSPSVTRDQARTAVITTTARREQATADLEQARLDQAEAIRAAIHAGVPVTELVRLTGLTKQWIYGLRD